MKNSQYRYGKTSKFKCDDAAIIKWDETNGDFSPRNEALRHAQLFVDMWQELVTDVPIHSKLDALTLLTHVDLYEGAK